MRAYYGSRLSPNQTETPEGFLICLNVPIARTGTQTYLRSELGFADDPTGLVDVIRTEEEVFSPATIASFEGKPATEDHPPVEVKPDNISAYDRGHVQNVHRGTGDESDLLIADLYITSPPLIDAIRSGRLREVSCGYDCEYRMDEQGRLYQCGIRGNHVAVVSAGRAGPRVAIKDSGGGSPRGVCRSGQSPDCRRWQSKIDQRGTHEESNTPTERGNKTMAKKTNSLFSRMFAGWAKDADPQEVADAIEEIAASSDTEPEAAPAPAASDCGAGESKDGGEEVLQQLVAAVAALTEKVNALTTAHDEDPAPAPAADEDALDALEEEVKGDEDPGTLEDQEESHTVPADELPEETTDEDEVTADEDGPEAPASSLPENPIPGADRAVALAAIRAIKPIIAKLPAAQRKAAADAAAKQIRKAIGRDARARTNGYAAINQTMRQKAKAKDSKARVDQGQIGKNIMASRNPHYKKA